MVINTRAFDIFAPDYDATFTHTRLGHLLRARVWATLSDFYKPETHILELACGTGEDAVWLGKQEISVTATDGSAEMIRRVGEKTQQQGVTARVRTKQLSLQDLMASPQILNPYAPFDGVLSNFGGLNTIQDWSRLAQALARLVRPGGQVLLVPMGPVCLWEIGWYLLHGQVKPALRRFQASATAQIGPHLISVWYPSARQLRRDFSPWFQHVQTESLGLWLPPSYLGHFVEHWPGLFARLNAVEQATAGLTGGWGDHYVIRFVRKDSAT